MHSFRMLLPCKCEPGLFGYIFGCFGIVGPEMRFTEHIHMLIQVLGFGHPQDLFRGRRFVSMFGRLWPWQPASIVEAWKDLQDIWARVKLRKNKFFFEVFFWSYIAGAVMEQLQELPVEFASSQVKSVGAHCVQESLQAQLAACILQTWHLQCPLFSELVAYLPWQCKDECKGVEA